MYASKFRPSVAFVAATIAVVTVGLVPMSRLSAQCAASQGNATLTVNGLRQIGNDLRVAITALPQAPVFLAIDGSGGPMVVPGLGTICLGPTLHFLTGSSIHPLQIVPTSGSWQMDLSIPLLPSLVGSTFYMQGLVLDAAAPNGAAISNGLAITVAPLSSYHTVFFDGFEATPSQGPWSAPNGLWGLGAPTAGPQPFGGSQCAATNLGGNYPVSGVDTTLATPHLQLPAVTAGERILLRFRVWCDTEDEIDWMRLRVATGLGGAFQDLPGTVAMTGTSRVWTLCGADLTAFAGQIVRVGCRFVAASACGNCTPIAGLGVYLDDVHIFVAPPPTIGLQCNWDGDSCPGYEWYADNGIWQVGAQPTAVAPGNTMPPAPVSGPSYAGTDLATDYPASGANTRLISPPFVVPSPVSPQLVPVLEYRHSIHCESSWDFGRVEYSIDGGTTWTQFPATVASGPMNTWAVGGVALLDAQNQPLTGQTIQIAFYFESRRACGNCSEVDGAGWFIDDIVVH